MDPENTDSGLEVFVSTCDFVQHDFTVRYEATDNITIRAGFNDLFDVVGRRYFAGVTYRL